MFTTSMGTGNKGFYPVLTLLLAVCFFLSLPPAFSADILVTGPAEGTNGSITHPSHFVPLEENQSLTVEGTGSILVDETRPDTPFGASAILGTESNEWVFPAIEGGNTIIIRSGATVTTNSTGDHTNTTAGIKVYGFSASGGAGLSGNGSLAEGASNIVIVENNADIITTGNQAPGVSGNNNNTVNISGSIQTTGTNSHGISGQRSNKILLSGDIRTAGTDAVGIYGYERSIIDVTGRVDNSGIRGHGMYSAGFSDINHAGSITTAGEGAAGIYGDIANQITISGDITTTGREAHGILSGTGNGIHISGGISAQGPSSYAVYTRDRNLSVSPTTIHLLDGAAVNGGIHSESFAFLTFGLAKNAGNQAVLTAEDNTFRFTYHQNITSIDGPESGWDGYLAGGTTTLSGAINRFQNLFIGGASFDGAVATKGFQDDFNLNAIPGAQAALNVTQALTTTGTIKIGQGSVYTLSGTHTHRGTDITGPGTLNLGGGVLLNNASGGVQQIGELKVDRGNTGTLGGNSATAVTTAGIDGTLDYTATADTAFGTTNLNGTLNQESGNSLTLSFLNVATGQNGVISGSGPGRVIIGDTVVTGSLSLYRGLSAVNPVSVNPGGTLSLSNTLEASGGVSNQGSLLVDDGKTGIISGDYTQSGSGAVQVGASSSSSYGRLSVTGTADLSANNIIRVKVTPNDTLAINDQLASVITAGRLVTDENLLKVRDNSAMWSFAPRVAANSVDLLVRRQLTCLEAVNNSGAVSAPLASGAAFALDHLIVNNNAGRDMQAVLDEMGAMETGSQVAGAVAQTVPALTSSGPLIGFDLAANGAARTANARLESFSGLSSGDPVFREHGLWAKPFYAKTDQERRNNIDGYDADTYGLAIGADTRMANGREIGFALSQGRASVETDSDIYNQSQDIESWQAILYGSKTISDSLTLDLITGFGLNDNESARHITFGGSSRTALARYGSWHGLVDSKLAKTYPFSDNLTLGTSLALRYIYLKTDSYTETGAGGLNLEIQESSADTLVGSLAGTAGYSITENQKITGQLELGYDFLADESSLVSTYTGGGPSFVVKGNAPHEVVCRGALGYELSFSTGLEITAQYLAEAREDFINQTGFLNFRIPF